MASPFPGMNPFLERRAVWHDFHESFIPTVREVIAAHAGDQFVVRIDDHVYIHELPLHDRQFLGRADLGVSSQERRHSASRPQVLEAPAHVQLPHIDTERASFVEIRDRDNWEVITIVELLSPANKAPGPDREQYLGKRGQILHSPTHLVEIDLLRGGPRMPMENLASCDYCVLVSPWQDRPRAAVWPIALRQPLPVIPVPLSEGHAPVPLDLQALVHRVYDAARYANYVYRGQPEPPLPPGDETWALAILRDQGLAV